MSANSWQERAEKAEAKLDALRDALRAKLDAVRALCETEWVRALIEDRARLQVELQIARGEGGHTVCGDPQPFPPYTGRCELPAGHLFDDPTEPAHRCGNVMWGDGE